MLALVCNPVNDAGHVMAVSLVDIKDQPPQVRIAINQARAGQHRDVLEECQSMLQSIFQALGHVHQGTHSTFLTVLLALVLSGC